ncbi:MAG: exodeoxyribonuclease V subunit beta [Victivallales bacterium]|nr:exodeoxyribonuclease V subunit beta [Victivallales bacterium]
MNEFNLLHQPIGPGVRTLIEAGAGTGKTYQLENLYLRLLLEGPDAAPAWHDLGLRHLLTVTFTEAATAELIERIRANLATAVAALEADPPDDDAFPAGILTAWLARYAAAEQPHYRLLARQRLKSALLDFDEAAVMTIHGFCARMLGEFTFESGLPFDTELLEDQSDLLREVVDDWWRQTVYPSPALAAFAEAAGLTPDAMVKLAERLHANPEIAIVAAAELPADPATAAAALLQTPERWWSPQLADEIRALPFKTAPARAYPVYLHRLQLWFEQHTISAGLPDALAAMATAPLTGAVLKRKAAAWSPELAHFAAAATEFSAGRKILTAALKKSLLDFLHHGALERRKHEMQVHSFDDLLLSMRQTLRRPVGPRFAAAIRQRYRVVMIDEFQDTDPVQYEIFNAVFRHPDAMMLMVGDPKQAIYGFRGADVFAYLEAADRLPEESKPTLIRNYRSSAALLDAVNALFDLPLPFADPRIRYPAAVAGRPAARLIIAGQDTTAAPLELWLPTAWTDGPTARGQAEKRLAAITADRIAAILNHARHGRAGYRTETGDIPVRAADIAVLTNKHHQAALVRRELVNRGVNAVIQKSACVFAAAEAVELYHVLNAVVNPGHPTALRTALATSLFAQPLDRISAAFAADAAPEVADGGEKWLDIFAEYHRLWEQDGFIRMFRRLLATDTAVFAPAADAQPRSVRTNLLLQTDGERRITNLLHLGELLHRAGRNGMMGMTSLLEWLRARILDPEDNAEYEQRLESDDDAVKIMTVFKSKGLQFPIVFCPFTWERGFRGSKKAGAQPEDFVFHTPAADGTRQARLFLGDSPPTELQLRHYNEELSETLRLLYVAVTRARYFCAVADGNIRRAEDSALRYLMTDGTPEHLNGHLLEPSNTERPEIPARWQKAGIRIVIPTDATTAVRLEPEPAPATPTPLPWPEGKIIPRHSGVMSFSSLAEGSHTPQARNPDRDDPEAESAADIPATTTAMVATPTDVEPEAENIPLFAGFPRGAVSGDCVHQMFEQLDFTLFQSPEGEKHPTVTALLDQKLRRFGYIPANPADPEYPAIRRLRHRQLQEMFGHVLRTPLRDDDPEFRLCRLPAADRVAEMNFFFPVTGDIDLPGVNRLVHRRGLLGYRNDFAAAVNAASIRFQTGEGPRRGFMTGKIDLLFRYRRRYFILDWKTTCLGDRYRDYRQPALLQNMFDAAYILQYYIYTLAADKYLRRRLPGYDYERDFGGVFYLYVRGINGRDPAGGVFFDRPDLTVVQQLHRLFPEQ